MKVVKAMKPILKKILPRRVYLKLQEMKRRWWNRKFGRFTIEVHLADHCNLNCVGCNHFSPLAEEHFLDVNDYKRDCKRLSELCGRKIIHTIHLMGGEPLLHKDIIDIMAITRANFNRGLIKVVTNGILLERMGPEFWKACNANRVIVSITPYPISLDMEKIHETGTRYGVCIEIFMNVGNGAVKMFKKYVIDERGLQDREDSFRKCDVAECHHLYEGKLYMCPHPAYIKYFNRYFHKNLEVSPDDYIDIYHVNDIGGILKFFSKSIPFCRYCDINAIDNVEWSISKKHASEWLKSTENSVQERET